MKKTFLFFISASLCAHGQIKDSTVVDSRIFQLGEITVKGSNLTDATVLSSKEIQKYNRVDVSSALNVLPGITLGSVGPRNESVVNVRGFDLRQVPVEYRIHLN